MLKPLVMYPSLSVTVTEQQEEGIVLAIQGLEESREERSTPSQVYSKVLMVLKMLHTHLLGTVQMEKCSEHRDHTERLLYQWWPSYLVCHMSFVF